MSVERTDGERLQKVLAAAGVASRRVCEQYIVEGRVEVNGVVVTELGSRIDPAVDRVAVDGTAIQLDVSKVYVMLNKPTGVVSSMADDRGRRDLREFVGEQPARLFNVGRLDADTSGLLLLTNDGELAHRLAHPKYQVPKTYLVDVTGRARPNHGKQLLAGVELDDGPARLDAYRIVDQTPNQALIEVRLHEGRNRIVRRMFEEVGLPVGRLVRTQIGPIRLGDLRQGRTRVLGRTELGTLMKAVDL